MTALIKATQIINPEIVKVLIAAGANVDIVDLYGRTALIYASRHQGNLEAVKLLIAAGANVNHADDSGTTALMNACINGLIEIAKVLIAAGADINKRGEFGNTALIYACKYGHLTTVKLLVSKGADVDMVNDRGQSALDIATGFERIEIINFLTKVKNRGYLQDFQRVSRTARRTVRSRQGQLETLTPLDPDVSRIIAQMSLNSFGKSSLDAEIRYLRGI
jgi:ankyrin repeat protein